MGNAFARHQPLEPDADQADARPLQPQCVVGADGLTERVTTRMRVAGVAGRTVTITVRFADFTTITRSRTLGEATDVTQEIFREDVRSYDALGLQRARIRLVGVRLEGLVPRERVHRQLVLGQREHGWSEADRAADRVVRRFGPDAVRPASLLS